MVLSDELIAELVKVTDDRQKQKQAAVVYGTIRDDGTRKYVQIDGSDAWAPVETMVEIAAGDRVSVNIRNHTATVTGNLTDPSIGTVRAGAMETSIKQAADSIILLAKDNERFSEFKQTVEGFSFMGTGGTVKITGGDINLTGAITFSDLNEELAGTINEANETASDAASDASAALSRAKSIANGNYLNGTFIDGTTIKSPIIEGNIIKVHGTFQTATYGGRSTGYMGSAQGMDGQGNITYGVALANEWDEDSEEVSNSYVIVTNAGVRLQYGDNSVVVSGDGIFLNGPKIYWNNTAIHG